MSGAALLWPSPAEQPTIPGPAAASVSSRAGDDRMKTARRKALAAALAAGAILLAAACTDAAPPSDSYPFDILITDARVIDGTGGPPADADVGVRGDRIMAVGDLSDREAARTIDAAGRVVAPGFVDMMGQASLVLITDPPSAESKLRQGITTYLSGEGSSAAPQSEATLSNPPVVDGDTLRWRRYSEYFAIMEQHGIPINVVHDVGLTQVRRVVLGNEDVAPTPEQLEEMKALVREGMEDGAVGVSTSLIYPPAIYASTEELIALSAVAGEYGGVYFTHMRNESHAVLEAIREALTIGEGAGVPVHIYHLKAAGQRNWPLMDEALALIDSARTAGMDVTADIYPYIRNGIGLGSFLHPRHYARGTGAFLATLGDPDLRARLREEVETDPDWENWYQHVGMDWNNVLIVSAPASVDPGVVNRSVAEAAEVLGTDPWNAFFDLVQAGGVSVNPLSMNEEQKWAALRAPFVMIDTDASPVNPASVSSTHPRAFGAFPRVIAKYVMEDGVITLEEAVRRMTSLAARRLGFEDRGTVEPGMAADLVVFDPARLRDRAEFGANATLQSEGVDYLFVNGELVIDDGELTDAQPGRLLRRTVR
ncbi:MAG: D-aminoacylase [Gemmatimonadetes bacterium]|nr:D-aminoacylase [Gemmatimonadota bacterium]MYC91753.1 D-aminoacylase [Gemmatimonadota bacterium]